MIPVMNISVCRIHLPVDRSLGVRSATTAISSKLERTYSLHISEGVVAFALLDVLFDPLKLPSSKPL